jgi:Ornithine cyclodeaminase/mu-crystallin family
LTSFEIKTSTNLEQTVRGADVVITLTPARGPIVMAAWIRPAVPVGNSILLATDIESDDVPALCERFVA